MKFAISLLIALTLILPSSAAYSQVEAKPETVAQVMYTRTYHVPLELLLSKKLNPDRPYRKDQGRLRALLEDFGIKFPPGGEGSSEELVLGFTIRDSATNLKRIEEYLEANFQGQWTIVERFPNE